MVVFNRKFQPTCGQPGRPGYTAHTSGRLPPYEAFPHGTPSTVTATRLIAASLSTAQPPIAAWPLNAFSIAFGSPMERRTGLDAVWFATLNDVVAVVLWPSTVVAVTASACVPSLK